MLRREFITALGTAAIGSPLLNDSISIGNPNELPVPLGIILNTVKAEMKDDYRKTLERLAGIGYRYLEGSFYGESVTEYKKLTTDLSLSCIGGGSAMGDMINNLEKYLKTGEALEYEYIVCYYPWLTGNDQIDIPSSYAAVENLNQLGRRCKQAGFKFAWHPHNWEFIPREQGKRPFDIIMQNTDPEYVSLQLDLYWVTRGGSDAVKEMKRYPGRTSMFHVKDMSTNTDQSIACVGDGTIDFKSILSYALKSDIKYWFVENETDNSSIECARASAEHLKGLLL